MNLKNFSRSLLGKGRINALTPGSTAPPITLTAMDGQKVSLADALAAGAVLVAFFKVSCPTCQFTFPYLQRMYEMFGGAGFTVCAISQNDADDTREFLEKYGITFPALLDERGYPVSNQFGLTNVPTMFLISQDGKIQMSSVGFSRADLERVASMAASVTGNSGASLFRPGEAVPEYKPG